MADLSAAHFSTIVLVFRVVFGVALAFGVGVVGGVGQLAAFYRPPEASWVS